jgi:hypothetical protein
MTEKAEAQTTMTAAKEAFGKRCTFLYNARRPRIVRMPFR